MSLADLIKNYYNDSKTDIKIEDKPTINGGRVLTITVEVSELSKEDLFQKEIDRLKKENADLQAKLFAEKLSQTKKQIPLTWPSSPAVPYKNPFDSLNPYRITF